MRSFTLLLLIHTAYDNRWRLQREAARGDAHCPILITGLPVTPCVGGTVACHCLLRLPIKRSNSGLSSYTWNEWIQFNLFSPLFFVTWLVPRLQCVVGGAEGRLSCAVRDEDAVCSLVGSCVPRSPFYHVSNNSTLLPCLTSLSTSG